MINLFRNFAAFADQIREGIGDPVVVAIADDASTFAVQVAFHLIPGLEDKRPIQLKVENFDPTNPALDVGQAKRDLIEGVRADLAVERERRGLPTDPLGAPSRPEVVADPTVEEARAMKEKVEATRDRGLVLPNGTPIGAPPKTVGRAGVPSPGERRLV